MFIIIENTFICMIFLSYQFFASCIKNTNTFLFAACCYFFVESMDGMERMDVKSVSKEMGATKLSYSSSIPTIKPLATTNTGLLFLCFWLISTIFFF